MTVGEIERLADEHERIARAIRSFLVGLRTGTAALTAAHRDEDAAPTARRPRRPDLVSVLRASPRPLSAEEVKDRIGPHALRGVAVLFRHGHLAKTRDGRYTVGPKLARSRVDD